MNTKTLPPPPKVIRLTIPVTPEVHEAFTRIAKASRMPVGRAMGDWLGDTIDAASYMATTLEKARAAPRIVAQEIHAYALGLADETGALLAKVREKGRAGPANERKRSAPESGGAATHSPPPCNTGGKVPEQGKPKRGGKSL